MKTLFCVEIVLLRGISQVKYYDFVYGRLSDAETLRTTLIRRFGQNDDILLTHSTKDLGEILERQGLRIVPK